MQGTKTQVQAPLRSLDQRMEALRRANEIRVKRAKLKKDLKAGSAQIEMILRNPPAYVETAKVFDILMAVPKFGRVKAARFRTSAGSASRRPWAASPTASARSWWRCCAASRAAQALRRHRLPAPARAP